MLRTIEKIGPIPILERVWFEEKPEAISSKALLIRHMRVEDMNGLQSRHCAEVETLWSDLTVEESEMLKPMRKQVRYEIRRGQKENIEIKTFDSQAISKLNLLEEFEQTYNHFCEISNQAYLKKSYNRKMLEACMKQNGVVMTVAKFDKGRVYHIYETDGKVVLLNYSASDFRNEDVDNNLAARANKLLHYEDMIYFKKKGCKVYDWGNVSDYDNPNGIDNFKLSFGGEYKKLYYLTILNHLLKKH